MLASRRRQPPRVARVTTFADLLARRLRDAAGQPLVTWYDHATGERVELSVATYANWVAKTASLLAEEHDAERGGSLRIDLPTHWLGPVFLGAAWTLGLVVATDEQPDAVVCGPAGLDRWAPEAGGFRCWPARCCRWGCASPSRCPQACTTWAWRSGRSRTRSRRGTRPEGRTGRPTGLTQDELWSQAAAGTSLPSGGRLLATANPASPSGLAAFIEPLARGGSLVLVSNPDAARLEALSAAERCTNRFVAPA